MTPEAAIRALIVDDEPLARERIRLMLAEHPDVQVVGECEHGAEAVERILETSPDLVFLDVQMPGMDGFGVLEAVGPAAVPAVIFVTAYDRYALRAFEAHALDYLLKPFERDRFRLALERARAHLGSHGERELERRLQRLLDEMHARPRFPARLTVRSGTRISFVGTHEVDWIEAEANYARLHVAERSYLVRDTMGGMEARLDPAQFVRIHRSTIVRIDKIREVEASVQGEYIVVLQDGTRLTSSRSYRRKLVELMGLAP
ncbi:MAG: yehT 1 [Gemmatimonadetes bacterium]|nr:yehT 1 [Gemmatimonadota bacterium]